MMSASTDQTTGSRTSYFTSPQWVLFGVLILCGLLFRWISLGERPLHHDESLHAMFGFYYYSEPAFHYYKYDPMLHGPLLYNVMVAVYNSLGVSDWSARFPAAFLGSLGLLLPYWFRRYFSPTAVLALTAAVAFSPTLIYWARFIREDIFVFTGIFLSLIGIFLARGTTKSLLFFTGVALQFCSKENSYVHVALILGYFIYEFLFQGVFLKEWRSSLKEFWNWLKENPIGFALGLALLVFIYCTLYSAFYWHWEGVLDGLYRKSLKYWLEHHSKERISGPFNFHLYVLSWYESLFIILVIIHAVILYYEASLPVRIIAGVWACLTAICGFVYWNAVLNEVALWSFFKLKDGLDLIGFMVLVMHPLLVTTHHLARRESRLAFTGYLFFANFFTYSYLGEKVPWLSQYPFVWGLVYLTMFFDDYFKRKPIQSWRQYSVGHLAFLLGIVLMAVGLLFFFDKESAYLPTALGVAGTGLVFALLGLADEWKPTLPKVNLLTLALLVLVLYNGRAAMLTNYVYAGEANEYLSQVHTTRDIRDLAVQVRKDIELQTYGYRPNVWVDGEATWPLTWYFRKLDEYKYTEDQKGKGFMWRFENEGSNAHPLPGFKSRLVHLRGWWVPDFSQVTLKRFILYALNHQPWNSVGYADVAFMRKSDDAGKGVTP